VNVAAVVDSPAAFTGNRIESSASLFYRSNAQMAPSANEYRYLGAGEASFTLGDRHNATLAALQAAGIEMGSTLTKGITPTHPETSLRLDASIDFVLDGDDLLAPGPRAQLMVLRSLALQYGPGALAVTVHFRVPSNSSAREGTARANALLDLDADLIRFEYDAKQAGAIRLLTADGRVLEQWHSFQNASALGGAVRAHLGAPRFAQMPRRTNTEDKQ